MQDISEEDEQKVIRVSKKYGIKKDILSKGYLFAKYINEGERRTAAHRMAFGSTVEESRSKATAVYNRKWIQELIEITKIENETYYTELRIKIIERLSEIIEDRFSSSKEIESAAKTLKGYIDPQLRREDEKKDEEDRDEGVLMMQDVLNKIQSLTKGNKMINERGEITDVELIED